MLGCQRPGVWGCWGLGRGEQPVPLVLDSGRPGAGRQSSACEPSPPAPIHSSQVQAGRVCPTPARSHCRHLQARAPGLAARGLSVALSPTPPSQAHTLPTLPAKAPEMGRAGLEGWSETSQGHFPGLKLKREGRLKGAPVREPSCCVTKTHAQQEIVGKAPAKAAHVPQAAPPGALSCPGLCRASPAQETAAQ